MESGGLDVLEDAINAPLARTDSTANQLRRMVARDRRSLRWWLWPGADQVLRQAALPQALTDCEQTRKTVEAKFQFWSEAIESPAGAAAIGLTFSNIPELGARTELDEDLVREVERAKRTADVARIEFQAHG